MPRGDGCGRARFDGCIDAENEHVGGEDMGAAHRTNVRRDASGSQIGPGNRGEAFGARPVSGGEVVKLFLDRFAGVCDKICVWKIGFLNFLMRQTIGLIGVSAGSDHGPD